MVRLEVPLFSMTRLAIITAENWKTVATRATRFDASIIVCAAADTEACCAPVCAEEYALPSETKERRRGMSRATSRTTKSELRTTPTSMAVRFVDFRAK
jgi:hypothetical protein